MKICCHNHLFFLCVYRVLQIQKARHANLMLSLDAPERATDAAACDHILKRPCDITCNVHGLPVFSILL